MGENLVEKANTRRALLRKVASFGIPLEDLRAMYFPSGVFFSILLLFGIVVFQKKI